MKRNKNLDKKLSLASDELDRCRFRIKVAKLILVLRLTSNINFTLVLLTHTFLS